MDVLTTAVLKYSFPSRAGISYATNSVVLPFSVPSGIPMILIFCLQERDSKSFSSWLCCLLAASEAIVPVPQTSHRVPLSPVLPVGFLLRIQMLHFPMTVTMCLKLC